MAEDANQCSAAEWIDRARNSNRIHANKVTADAYLAGNENFE